MTSAALSGAVARPSVARATLLLLFAAACFGSVSIFTVIGTRAGASLATLMVWRYLIALLLFVAVAGGASGLRLPPRRAVEFLLLGGGGQAAVTYVSLTSLRYITVATLGFLFYTYPAWITLFSAVRGSERLDRTRLVALALSLTGITVMVGSPAAAQAPLVGVLFALAAAIIYALYVPTINRLQGVTSALVTCVYIAAGAGAAFAIGGALDGTLTAHLTAPAWGAVAGLAVFSTVLAFLAFLRGMATLGPVRTAIISTVEPFWTAIVGALVLAQPLTPGTLAGGALIASAVILLQRQAARQRSREESA
jgi:drug/metabolite transporter (DMT)-like permease